VIEVSFLYFLVNSIDEYLGKSYLPNPKKIWLSFKRNRTSGFICDVLGKLGWGYYLTIIMIWWNFVSYLMLSGFVFVLPGLISTVRSSQPREVLNRRLNLAGWFLGLITLSLFPNFLLIPSQIQRHLTPHDLIITPDHSSVLQLRSEFFQQIPPEKFYSMEFHAQMDTVDDFIAQTITWEQDYGRWRMIGLLLTPDEVIQYRAADCQGQAAVTASLLISLGFPAWMVETPFHWWTHARDNLTGVEHNLNSHGHGGTQGNVLPQPIDYVFTHPSIACTNCPYIFSHNTNPSLYVAPPHKAIAIAIVGAHIFQRSGMMWNDVSKAQLTIMGVVVGLIAALYSSYFQGEVSGLKKRSLFGVIIGLFSMFGMSVWSTILYEVTLLHLQFTLGFMFYYLSSDRFNAKIEEDDNQLEMLPK